MGHKHHHMGLGHLSSATKAPILVIAAGMITLAIILLNSHSHSSEVAIAHISGRQSLETHGAMQALLEGESALAEDEALVMR